MTILAPYEQYRPNHFPGVLGGDSAAAMMLFDLETDPAEQRNVAARHGQVVQRLKGLYDKINGQLPGSAGGR